ncbi:hypothetical protein GOD54_23505 [Sinorhizobium medicae]|nr:hypothetical protein [Sinorhizobium medicae]
MALKLFNNILAYRMLDPSKLHALDTDELNELLGNKPARLPALTELSCFGWSEVLGVDDERVEPIRPQTFMLSVLFAERMLPGKVVRQRVSTKVKEIEKEEERKVYAREKNQIKDSIITEMLPHTFVDQKFIRVLICGPHIFVDTTSAKRGEDILCMLREALGSLAVKPVTVPTTPIAKFTEWYTTREMPKGFALTGDFKASNSHDESDFITGKGTDPGDERLSDLVAEDERRVGVLGLNWLASESTTVSYTVNEMLGVKGIKWPDEIMDMASADAGEEADQITLMRATFLLLAVEIQKLFKELLDALGGEEIPEDQLTNEEKFRRVTETYDAALKNAATIRLGSTREGRSGLVVGSEDQGEEDPNGDSLYADAVKFVRESNRPSIAAVQRKLKIGYNRAARMIERMEEDFIVTAMTSNGSRSVIFSSASLNAAADLVNLLPDDTEEELI